MTCNWNSFGLVYGGCPEFPPTWGRSSDGFGAFCASCTGTPRYRGAALTPPSGLWKPQRLAHLKARLVFLPPPPRGLPINAPEGGGTGRGAEGGMGTAKGLSRCCVTEGRMGAMEQLAEEAAPHLRGQVYFITNVSPGEREDAVGLHGLLWGSYGAPMGLLWGCRQIPAQLGQTIVVLERSCPAVSPFLSLPSAMTAAALGRLRGCAAPPCVGAG